MSDFSTAYPNSRKFFVEGPGDVRVPMREIALTGGEPPLRVYDTSGPQDQDVTAGRPELSAPRGGAAAARVRHERTARPGRHGRPSEAARPVGCCPACKSEGRRGGYAA